ncbi:MAG: APC family permease [Spirochaetes bacterium]|nr:APC family permease [Spirochaetota bacterium]
MADTQLKKVLGFWPIFGACFGIAISGSTLMLLGNVFAMTGMSFIVSQAVALVVMILVILAFSELSTMMPVAGGIETYTREALGLGMATGVTLCYFVATLSLAVNAIVDGVMLNMFVPGVPALAWGIILVTIYLILNLLGAKVLGIGLGFFVVIVIASYVIMGVLGYAGVGQAPVDLSKLGEWSGLRFGNIIAVSMIAIWFFVGIEMATPYAEEVKKPEKNLPRAMIAGIIVIFVIQLLLGPAMFAVLSTEELAGFTPHVAFAEKLFGQAGLYWVLVLQIALEFTTIGGVMFGISRLLYGLARDGMLPKVFAWLHPKFKTPWAALILIYVAVVVAMVVGAPFVLLSIASMIFFFIYLLVFVDLWILRRKKPEADRPFYAGGAKRIPVISIIGIIFILGVLVGNAMDDPKIISIGLPVVAVCFIFGIVFNKLRKA